MKGGDELGSFGREQVLGDGEELFFTGSTLHEDCNGWTEDKVNMEIGVGDGEGLCELTYL